MPQKETIEWEEGLREIINNDEEALRYGRDMSECEYGCKHRALELVIPFISQLLATQRTTLLDKVEEGLELGVKVNADGLNYYPRAQSLAKLREMR